MADSNLHRALMTMPPIANEREPLDWTETFVVNKFGHNLDVDTTTDPEDLWSYGGLYTYQSSAVTVYASSSNAGDNQTITVQGLDANWDRQSQTVTLNGQSQEAVPGTWLRVFRAFNGDSTAFSGVVYIAESDTLTGGVPNTASKVKAVIEAYDQQTQMALYTIPAGYTGFLLDWYGSIIGGVASGADLDLFTRTQGGVFRARTGCGIDSTGASQFNHPFPAPVRQPEKTDIKITVTRVTNNNTQVIGGFTLLMVKNSV